VNEGTCSCDGKACETHLKGPLSMVSLHATIAHGKPALREQGVQPQGLLPVPLSLQTKNDCQHILLRVQDASGTSCLDSMNSTRHDAVGWTRGGPGGGRGAMRSAGGGWGGRTKGDYDQLSERLATDDRQCSPTASCSFIHTVLARRQG